MDLLLRALKESLLVFSEIEEFKKRKTKMGETIDIKMMDFSDNLDTVKMANKMVV